MFYSANSAELPITQNFWVACASCHIEGRSDGVKWRFKVGPRDTPSNAGGALGTGPLLRTAMFSSVEDYWRIITEEQGGDGMAFRDDPTLRPFLSALQDYVNHAIPYPVPPRTDPAKVARGRELFNRASVGCATCHRGERYTDSGDGTLEAPRLYDVGSCETDPRWPDRAHTDAQGRPRSACLFDTPSLRGVADSAPYLHDGSAPTLRAVLERTRGRMGNIEGLSDADLDALVEFMRSL
jgi:Cytochrome c